MFTTTANFDAGLPWGMAAGISPPYIWKNYEYAGTNSGTGDFSVFLAKKMNNETESLFSFVAKLSYTPDSGADTFAIPWIGSGFSSYTATYTLKNTGATTYEGK